METAGQGQVGDHWSLLCLEIALVPLKGTRAPVGLPSLERMEVVNRYSPQILSDPQHALLCPAGRVIRGSRGKNA